MRNRQRTSFSPNIAKRLETSKPVTGFDSPWANAFIRSGTAPKTINNTVQKTKPSRPNPISLEEPKYEPLPVTQPIWKQPSEKFNDINNNSLPYRSNGFSRTNNMHKPTNISPSKSLDSKRVKPETIRKSISLEKDTETHM